MLIPVPILIWYALLDYDVTRLWAITAVVLYRYEILGMVSHCVSFHFVGSQGVIVIELGAAGIVGCR
jgi:hypothetical protein